MSFLNSNRTKHMIMPLSNYQMKKGYKPLGPKYIDDDGFEPGVHVYEYQFEEETLKNSANTPEDIANMVINIYLLFYNKDEEKYSNLDIDSKYGLSNEDLFYKNVFAFNDILNRITCKKTNAVPNSSKINIYYDTPYIFFMNNNISMNLPREELLDKLLDKFTNLVSTEYFTLRVRKVKIMIDNKIFLDSKNKKYRLLSIVSLPEISDTKFIRSAIKGVNGGLWEWEYKYYDYVNRFNINSDSMNEFMEAFRKKNFFTKEEVKPFFDSIIRVIPNRPVLSLNKITKNGKPIKSMASYLKRQVENGYTDNEYGFNKMKKDQGFEWAPKWNVPSFIGLTELSRPMTADIAFNEYIYRRGLYPERTEEYDYFMGVSDDKKESINTFSMLGNVYSPYRHPETNVLNSEENLMMRYLRNSVSTFNVKLADKYKDKNTTNFIYSLFGNPFYDLNISNLRDRGEWENVIGVESEPVKRDDGNSELYDRKTFTRVSQYWTDYYQPVKMPYVVRGEEGDDLFVHMGVNQRNTQLNTIFIDRENRYQVYYLGDVKPNYISFYYENMTEYLKNIENKATGQITGYKVEYDLYYEDENGDRVFLEENVFETYGKGVMKYNIAGRNKDKEKPTITGKDKKGGHINEEDLPKLYYDEDIVTIGGIPFVYVRD